MFARFSCLYRSAQVKKFNISQYKVKIMMMILRWYRMSKWSSLWISKTALNIEKLFRQGLYNYILIRMDDEKMYKSDQVTSSLSNANTGGMSTLKLHIMALAQKTQVDSVLETSRKALQEYAIKKEVLFKKTSIWPWKGQSKSSTYFHYLFVSI